MGMEGKFNALLLRRYRYPRQGHGKTRVNEIRITYDQQQILTKLIEI